MNMDAIRLTLLGLAAGAALLLGVGAPARAQTCSASIDSIAFGPIDTIAGRDIDRTANVTISCRSTLGTIVCPGIGAGPGGQADDGSRLLTTPGGATLRYQLYRDSARLLPWGSLEDPLLGTTPQIVLPGGPQSVTLPLYARIFGGQSIAPLGDYGALFSGAQTAFYYGGVQLGCSVQLLGLVTRPGFEVRAEVASHCEIDADPLDFGAHGLLNRALASATRLRVRCTPGARYSIALGGGSATGGLPRALSPDRGAGRIEYGLYRDEGHTLPWAASAVVEGVGDGLTRTIPVHGLVPAQPTPPAGRYTDTVVVTVTH